jgi:hypothetical protein
MQLNDELCEFLMGGVSIMLASRNAQLIPSIARAKGCRVVHDGAAKLRLFVSTAQAGELIDDVRASGMISATFSVPTTHRTMQLKGSDARITPLRPDERAAMETYVERFAAEIRPLGFSEEFTRAFFASSGDEIAIEVTPSEGFQQTPGPSAGARLA